MKKHKNTIIFTIAFIGYATAVHYREHINWFWTVIIILGFCALIIYTAIRFFIWLIEQWSP